MPAQLSLVQEATLDMPAQLSLVQEATLDMPAQLRSYGTASWSRGQSF
jgi:hypothetical protein